MNQTLENEGRFWVRDALSESDLSLFDEVSKYNSNAGSRLEWSNALAKVTGALSKLNDLVQDVLPEAKPVRFVSFNKTSKMNWSLPWHQDRVIAVRDKVETKGFINWSNKSGVWHCEPPITILENMFFARVHLDAATKLNGCMEIAIGSHKYGKILSQDTERIVAKLPKEICIANRGDILFVKALTLHRSTESESKSPRMTLRIDYSDQKLPETLDWKY